MRIIVLTGLGDIDMIFLFLIVLIMALILANVFISALVPKKRKQKGFMNPGNSNQSMAEEADAEVVSQRESRASENALVPGTIISLNQKMGLLNTRLLNLEQAVSALAREKIDSDIKQNTENGLNSLEKKKLKDISDFKEDAKIRIEVIESELEKLKGKPLVTQKKLETFDDKTEEKIRSLVYNTGRK